MKTQLEDVKKILDELRYENHHSNHTLAVLICQLEPKPDESRLLTDEETKIVLLEVADRYYDAEIDVTAGHTATAKAQRDLTASIKDAECHKRIQAVEETLQNLHSEAQEKWADDVIRLEEKKEAECQERIEKVRQDIMGIDCMEDIADIRKAITALVYSLKKQEEVKDELET